MPHLGEALSSLLLFVSLSFATALLLLALHHLWRPVTLMGAVAAVALSAGGLTAVASPPAWLVVVPASLGGIALLLARRVMAGFNPAGRILLLSQVAMLFVGSVWVLWFITSLDVSPVTRGLMLLGFPLLAFTLLPGLVQILEQWEVLCRERWSRRERRAARTATRSPMVSIHVPTHAEPPDVVIGTLDALARLNYANFEVLVIDNNTKDESLWRPVEAHCRRLGDRFKFFHLDAWPGAKAGALNFAMTETADEAELIAVVDADYHAEPDFLAALVGYFEDSNVGFVQTPHDYREWDSSTYLRMCYWEYQYFFRTYQISRNERDAAITVGTMCIIRRAALEDAGGWAEWCVTEDSELAVRIHALGYSSVYVEETFGRGLIPDTFAGYKKQRFRWTYGPVQTLKYHLPLFLFRGRRPEFTFGQWLHHLNHGVDRANIGVGLLLLPLGVALVASISWHREIIPVPFVLWASVTIGLVSRYLGNWLIYRTAVGCSFRDSLAGMLATTALSHTVAMASLWGVLTRTIPWRRTSKFKPFAVGPLAALRSAQAELLLGLLTLGGAAVAMTAIRPQGLVLMLVVGAVLVSLNYLAAPLAALLSERHIRAERNERSPAGVFDAAAIVEG